MSDDAKRGSPETNVDARLRVIVVFPGERAFCARLLSDPALLRRQSIDRLLRLSILHNEPPILCLRVERVAVIPQGTRIVFSYRSAGEVFQCAAPHFHSYIEASYAIFRISTGAGDPETVAITNSRSKEAFDRPCNETGSRSRALWQDANRMAIGNHALHPVLSFRAEARPHHDLSTGEVLPSDPRCFIPQA